MPPILMRWRWQDTFYPASMHTHARRGRASKRQASITAAAAISSSIRRHLSLCHLPRVGINNSRCKREGRAGHTAGGRQWRAGCCCTYLCLPPYASGFRPRRRDSYPLHPLSPAFVMLCVCGRWSFPTGYSKRPAVKSFSGVVRLGR